MNEVTKTQTVTNAATGEHYWFVEPEGFEGLADLPDDVTLHGPFKTHAEVNEDQRRVLLPENCNH